MVLESILTPLHAEKRPDEMIIFGFIITSVAILLSLWVFPSYASFAMVTFTVMLILPFMVKLMQLEKEKQSKAKGFRVLVHRNSIYFFIFLFLGFLIAYTTWFLLLPIEMANNLFFLQINTITEINSPTGAAILAGSTFVKILFNNLRILALSVVFSFIFGSGAIFILSWNASVLGVGIGNAIKLAVAASGSGGAVYFGAISFALIRFLIHGIPEITAYFLGGLAGGIVSFAILDYKLGFNKFSKGVSSAVKDGAMLIVFAVVLLVLSALIEILITPLFIQ